MSIIQDVAYFIYDVSKTIVGVRIREGKFEVFFEKPSEAGTIDERLEKIDLAKNALVEGLDAIDELKADAENSKCELLQIKRQLERTEDDHQQASEKLSQIKALAELETTQVRDILGIPSRRQAWVERVAGFVMGVVASIVAAYLWENGSTHFAQLKSYWNVPTVEEEAPPSSG